jgi:hypothetical protein
MSSLRYARRQIPTHTDQAHGQTQSTGEAYFHRPDERKIVRQIEKIMARIERRRLPGFDSAELNLAGKQAPNGADFSGARSVVTRNSNSAWPTGSRRCALPTAIEGSYAKPVTNSRFLFGLKLISAIAVFTEATAQPGFTGWVIQSENETPMPESGSGIRNQAG